MRSPMPTAGPQKPLIWGFRPLQTIFLQMKKPRNPLDYEVSVRAGDGVSALQWSASREPTDPAGETGPLGPRSRLLNEKALRFILRAFR